MSFRLWNLPIRWRILFLVYTNPSIDIETLKSNFQPQEIGEFTTQYQSLVGQNIISSENNCCCDFRIEPFLHVISFIYTTQEPITKDSIRNNVKHRNLNEIIECLIQSGIVFEYRAELNRKNFIIPIVFKQQVIDRINESIKNNLEQSDKLSDKSHLIMIQQDRSILSYNNKNNIKIEGLKSNELKLIVNLYADIRGKKNRIIGKTIEVITESIFNGNNKTASTTILSLMDKGILQCSYKEYYFLNNGLFTQIEPVFERNQKYLIKKDKKEE